MTRVWISLAVVGLTAGAALASMLVMRVQEPPVVAPVSIRPVAPKPPAPAVEKAPEPPPPDPEKLAELERKIRESEGAERVLDEETAHRALPKRLREGVVLGDGAANGVRISRAFASEAIDEVGYKKHHEAEQTPEQKLEAERQREEALARLGARCKDKWKPAAKARIKTVLKKKEEALAKGADTSELASDAQDLAALVDAAKTLDECDAAQAMIDRWEQRR
jgi:hypothetical protein